MVCKRKRDSKPNDCNKKPKIYMTELQNIRYLLKLNTEKIKKLNHKIIEQENQIKKLTDIPDINLGQLNLNNTSVCSYIS